VISGARAGIPIHFEEDATSVKDVSFDLGTISTTKPSFQPERLSTVREVKKGSRETVRMTISPFKIVPN
jgi:hypothetical protein